ncbi:TPA: DNA polymerase III subunit theta [Klebsiella aerogenes]|nr:DNA polymerase III subunit theta [Klebsiella aerogenes]
MAAKSPEERNKVNVDLAASGAANKEHLNVPVVAEVVMREQPEHLHDYFLQCLKFYREKPIDLPKASAPRYMEMSDAN